MAHMEKVPGDFNIQGIVGDYRLYGLQCFYSIKAPSCRAVPTDLVHSARKRVDITLTVVVNILYPADSNTQGRTSST